MTLSSESVRTLPVSEWKQQIGKGKLPDFQKKPTVFLFLAN